HVRQKIFKSENAFESPRARIRPRWHEPSKNADDGCSQNPRNNKREGRHSQKSRDRHCAPDAQKTYNNPADDVARPHAVRSALVVSAAHKRLEHAVFDRWNVPVELIVQIRERNRRPGGWPIAEQSI